MTLRCQFVAVNYSAKKKKNKKKLLALINNKITKLGTVPAAWEAEVGGCLKPNNLRPAWATQ
jgi:hypothetical protein